MSFLKYPPFIFMFIVLILVAFILLGSLFNLFGTKITNTQDNKQDQLSTLLSQLQNRNNNTDQVTVIVINNNNITRIT